MSEQVADFNEEIIHDLNPNRKMGKGTWVKLSTKNGQRTGILAAVNETSYEVHLVDMETGETVTIVPNAPFSAVEIITFYEDIPACRRPLLG